MKSVYYIGLNVHKEKIQMAVFKGMAEYPEKEKTLSGDLSKAALEILQYKKLGEVQVAYEAGCLGYALYHKLTEYGIDCRVIPPNKVFRPGNKTRIKNDATDAILIANMLQYHKGESIHIPTRDDEAARDLLRCRNDLMDSLRRAKQQLSKFLLRHNCIYEGKTNWTTLHYKWLRALKFERINEQLTFQNYLSFIEDLNARIGRVEASIEEIAKTPQYVERVQKLRAFKGIDYIIALSFICEIGDFNRFSSAGEFMSYLGLVPSESSSGAKISRGGITKTGNGNMRRLTIEAAWHYSRPTKMSKRLLERRKGTDEKYITHADKAINRLHKKYLKLIIAKKKPANVAITAVARELCGFVWCVMTDRM
jgi:transposase